MVAHPMLTDVDTYSTRTQPVTHTVAQPVTQPVTEPVTQPVLSLPAVAALLLLGHRVQCPSVVEQQCGVACTVVYFTSGIVEAPPTFPMEVLLLHFVQFEHFWRLHCLSSLSANGSCLKEDCNALHFIALEEKDCKASLPPNKVNGSCPEEDCMARCKVTSPLQGVKGIFLKRGLLENVKCAVECHFLRTLTLRVICSFPPGRVTSFGKTSGMS